MDPATSTSIVLVLLVVIETIPCLSDRGVILGEQDDDFFIKCPLEWKGGKVDSYPSLATTRVVT